MSWIEVLSSHVEDPTEVADLASLKLAYEIGFPVRFTAKQVAALGQYLAELEELRNASPPRDT